MLSIIVSSYNHYNHAPILGYVKWKHLDIVDIKIKPKYD